MAATLSKTSESINQKAGNYENRWHHYLNHTHNVLLGKMDVGPEDVILDLSCGTGFLAKQIMERGYSFDEIILNDIAQKMQAIAMDRFGEHGDISFMSNPADNINLADNSINKICSLSAFHNYEKHSGVINECHRLLKPGGQVFIIDWNNSGWFRPVNSLIKWKSRENINTASATQMAAMLMNHSFRITHNCEWYYRYWKLFYIIAEKRTR